MARYGQRPENALKRANGEYKFLVKFHVACADDVTLFFAISVSTRLAEIKNLFYLERKPLNSLIIQIFSLEYKVLSHNQTTMEAVFFLGLQSLWTWTNRPGPWIHCRKCSVTRNGRTTGRNRFLNQSCSSIWSFAWTFGSHILRRRAYFSIETCSSQLMLGPWSRS